MKVFLGGTCNDSKWREELINYLKIDYFNPVVDRWTEECQKEEIRQRELCDCCLYVLTPKMTGAYAIAEAVEDSIKRPTRTIVAIMDRDENFVFRPSQWKSLVAVLDLCGRNGAYIFENVGMAKLAGFLNMLDLEKTRDVRFVRALRQVNGLKFQ